MISLDSYKKWLPMEDSARLYLNENEYTEYKQISKKERKKQLKDLLEKPIANFTPINELYFRARWAEVLKMLHDGNFTQND